MPTNPPADIPEVKDEVREIEPGVYVRQPKGSKYIIEYRRDVCIGAISCSAIAGLTFSMDAENKAVLLGPKKEIKPDPNNTDLVAVAAEVDEDDVILAAAESCPVFAIIIREAATGKQIFPPLEEDMR